MDNHGRVWKILVVILVLSLVTSILQAENSSVGRAATQPELSTEITAYNPEADDPRTDEKVTRLTPGQSILVTCRYQGLNDGPYNLSVEFHRFVEFEGIVEEDPFTVRIPINETVTGISGKGKKQFKATSSSNLSRFYGGRFFVSCVAEKERFSRSDILRSSERWHSTGVGDFEDGWYEDESGNVLFINSSSQILEPAETTAYLDLNIDSVLENESLLVSYFGWTAEDQVRILFIGKYDTDEDYIGPEDRRIRSPRNNFFEGNFAFVPSSMYPSKGPNQTVEIKLFTHDPYVARRLMSSRYITVNYKPEIKRFDANRSDLIIGKSSKEVKFEAEADDPDGGDVNFSWDFDGRGNDTGPSVTHRFGETGTYDVELNVSDDEGDFSKETKEIIIRSPIERVHFVVGFVVFGILGFLQISHVSKLIATGILGGGGVFSIGEVWWILEVEGALLLLTIAVGFLVGVFSRAYIGFDIDSTDDS